MISLVKKFFGNLLNRKIKKPKKFLLAKNISKKNDPVHAYNLTTVNPY